MISTYTQDRLVQITSNCSAAGARDDLNLDKSHLRPEGSSKTLKRGRLASSRRERGFFKVPLAFFNSFKQTNKKFKSTKKQEQKDFTKVEIRRVMYFLFSFFKHSISLSFKDQLTVPNVLFFLSQTDTALKLLSPQDHHHGGPVMIHQWMMALVSIYI